MKRWLLTYTLAPDYLDRRAAARTEHLALVQDGPMQDWIGNGGNSAGVAGNGIPSRTITAVGAVRTANRASPPIWLQLGSG